MAAVDFNLKTCYRCQEAKSVECFGAAKRNKDGLKSFCKACHNAANKASRERNPEAARIASRRWAIANPDRVAEKKRRWHEANPGRMKELTTRWVEANPERVAANTARLRLTPEYRIKRTISSRIRNMLGGKGGRRTIDLVGYEPSELRAHLERQFLKGMSWDNFGEWHIDHIVPAASFNISSLDDPAIKRAWALTNLRPLWAEDNLRKNAKRTHLI